MANNRIQIKRTAVAGRTANTTDSGNSQYIDAGEFALNMADGILHTSNGSAVITVGSNLVNQRITNSLTLDNDRNLYFKTVNTSASVGMRQQNDDNFVFYSTNTTYGQRPVWSIFANSDTSAFSLSVPTIFNANVTLGGVALSANGTTGTAGQILASNGSATYWVSPGAASVNTAAQFGWTNIHTFSANVSFNGNGIGIASNTGAVYLGGISDANWRIGRNTGATTKWRYTTNSIDIITANSNLEGMSIGLINGNSYFETGYLGTFIASNVTIGNTSSNATINSTAFSGTANNATNLGGTAAASYQTTAGLAANVATLTANNATNLGGVAAASYVQNTDSRTLSGNLVISGTSFTPSSNTILLGNSTQRWVLSANTGSFSGAVSGITTLAAGNTTITGFANVTTTLQVTANAAINGTLTTANPILSNIRQGYSTTVTAAGTTVLTVTSNRVQLFTGTTTQVLSLPAPQTMTLGMEFIIINNSTGSIEVRAANAATVITVLPGTVASCISIDLTAGNGAAGWNAEVVGFTTVTGTGSVVLSASPTFTGTVVANNITLTGFANVTTSVNSALLTVGTSFIANTTGAYHTGVVNAASYTVGTSFTANSTGVYTGNSIANVSITSQISTLGDSTVVPFIATIAANNSFSSGIVMRKIGNTTSSSGIVSDNTELGYHGFSGWDGSGYQRGAFVIARTSQAWSATARGTNYQIYTTPNDTTTNTLRLHVDQSGNIGIGNATPSHRLRVEGDLSLLSGIHANGSLGTAADVLTSNGSSVYWAAAAGGSSNAVYVKGGAAAIGTLAAGGSNLFRVNGNTLNYNTTFVAGENGSATGPITVAPGITLTVETGARVAIL